MRTIAWLMLLLWIAAPAFAQESTRGGEKSSPNVPRVEHPFVRWGSAILIEDVMINGKGPYRFMLDTGAEGAGRIDSAVVKELEIATLGTATAVGVLGEEKAMTRHRIDALSIGDVTFHNVELISRDYAAETPPGLKPFHGILGFHLFRDHLLTINYPARKIVLEQGELPEPDGKTILAMDTVKGPQVDVQFGDHKAQALLDTGAMGEIGLPSSVAENVKFAGELQVRGSENGAELRTGTLAGALKLGEFEFAGPAAIVADPLRRPVVGVRILAALSVTYDQQHGRLRLERPTPRRGFGLILAVRGAGPWQYRGVSAGGVAEAAGLLATDTIVSINGRPFAELDQEDMSKLLDGDALTLEIERDGKRQEIRLNQE